MTKRVICIQGPLCALLFLLSRVAEVGAEAKLSFQEEATNTGLLHREKRQLLFPNTTLLQLNIGVTVPTPAKDINCNWAFQANFQLPWNQTQIPTDIFMANSGYDGDSRVIRAKRETEEIVIEGKRYKDCKPIEDKDRPNSGNQQNKVAVKTDDGSQVNRKLEDIVDSDLYGVYKSESRLTHLYQEVEKMLDSFGYEGSPCVLRTLCQLAKEPLHSDYNEDLLHELASFVLDPRNDQDNIKEEEDNYPYLEAFARGRALQDCTAYYGCSLNIVDIFTALKNN